MSRRRWVLAGALVGLCALVAHSLPAMAAPGPSGSAAGEQVGHVFVINLENKGFDETFGPDSPAPYLSQVLPRKGQLLTQYYATAHESLGNYLAQISGQGPNVEVQSDCQYFTDFQSAGTVEPGQEVGQGCVFPADVETVADQLEAAGLEWRGYMEDMGNSATEPQTCRRPEIGARDETQSAEVGDQYATRHNPFMYFHSIIDSPSCDERVVPLDRLRADLRRARTTPNLAYISPNLCNDGHDQPCVDGRPGGLVSADEWLRMWVPRITHSPAFEQDGLLIVTFDEAETEPPNSDASACCGEGPGPNSPLPGIFGPGGGRIGAVVLSPFVTPGSVNDTPYNHYALLCSIEDIFGLEHLGYAAAEGLRCFGDDVYRSDPQARWVTPPSARGDRTSTSAI